MMEKIIITTQAVIALILFLLTVPAQAQQGRELKIVNTFQQNAFPLATNNIAASILVDTADATVVSIAAKAVASDIGLVSGHQPTIISSPENNNKYVVIAGTIGQSSAIDALIKKKKLDVSKIQNKWESFIITTINAPMKSVTKALVIAGSNPRGTAYGLLELSRAAGVSPWVWWADVAPAKSGSLFVLPGTFISNEPAVKYRGIFLNDEDWGLQPWAAKTFEPETGDIGPKTYVKIFELLLRLRANLIWPAMHDCTKPFFTIPGNAKVAEDYAILIGTSHAEPMLRNNVREWNEKTMGHFNYLTNKEMVQQYWEDRVKESKQVNAIYTMGMRGVHDSKMEGVNTPQEAVPVLEQILEDQRKMLQIHLNKDVTAIPQVFTAYKEVLDIYDNGLKLPDDITIVWPDDNYGYIQRLTNDNEQKRSGGTGVYYHTSYWGRPHDYLWLNGTHPSLLREEMMKAYEMKADRLWVLNIGDIKPLEYNIEMFMDMAFNPQPFKNGNYTRQHLSKWITQIFGKEKVQKIEKVLWQYHQLAFERRPEFMGWSQTEPTTQTKYTDYNHFYYGDEAQKRIDKYESLEKEVKILRQQVAAKDTDAFYQLVYYPVTGASLMNKKFLYRDKSYLYAKQHRLSAVDYAQMSQAAYDSIVKETDYYNNQLAGGKWKDIMSMKPRNLPVFGAPGLPNIHIDSSDGWSIAPEGFVNRDSSLVNGTSTLKLPMFDRLNQQHYFIDVYLTGSNPLLWTASASAPWIQLSQTNGQLSANFGKKQIRIYATIDWDKAPKNTALTGQILFKGMGKQHSVTVTGNNLSLPQTFTQTGFIENNGYVSIKASQYSRQVNKGSSNWKILPDIGYAGAALEAGPELAKDSLNRKNTRWIQNNSSYVEYDFYTFSSGNAKATFFSLPTHPLNNAYSMRYAVSVDNCPLQLVDFRTYGRSEEWKQNVLRNRAEKKVSLSFLNKGSHRLRIYSVDPGVILDAVLIDLGGLKKAYSIIPETKPFDKLFQ